MRSLASTIALVPAAALLAALLACDPGATATSPPSATCTEAGVQCQLKDGPLGVCGQSHCRVDEVPPCFRCIPQH